ncbi:helix-turn-helix domain-containing protein [Streptomyces sp. NPDC050534]|uniref:helix-turn-helix domain-containing protein n=1 Tax=Streptomyces sp. NPDC050534 TaxID=3365625 RepID=UPI00378FD233
MTVTTTDPRLTQSLGDLLRQWRKHRLLSQMELATLAEISPRHLSFIENGRSVPSRDAVLRLAEALGLELRERNPLLLAAGYAPVYHETSLEAPHMSAVRGMVRQVLAAHEPYPAVVLDRYWNRVDANDPAWLFGQGVHPELLEEPVNLLRVSLHPEGMAPRIANLGEWRGHLLSRLRQQVTMTADPDLVKLYDELSGYPCDQPEPKVELPGPGEIAVPLRLRHEGRELAFFSTMATFGTPLDITVAELAIESFFPADAETAEVLRTTDWKAAAGPATPQ